MTTLTHPTRNNPGIAYREDTAAVVTIAKEAETVRPAADVPMAVQKMLADALPPHTKSLPVRMALGFLAFYDWLSGPGMTARARLYRDLAEADSEKFLGSRGV